MGIVSIGRSLLLRQLFFAGLLIGLGAYAYMALGNIETLVAAGPDAGGDATTLMDVLQTATLRIAIATGLAVVLGLSVSLLLTYLTVVKPVKAIAAAIENVANGDRSMVIEGEHRRNEIGAMARGLNNIRNAMVVLEDRVAATATNHASASPAMLATSHKIEQFSAEMVAHVRRLGSITKRLADTSEAMIVAARHASDGSDQATNASSNAAGDVSSVATASEQLLDSIEEISRQVVQSTNVVKTAVERAVETNAGMARLSTAAQKVGDVVSLISRIAAQTNLLALNATIEAARAGEAGRGFAVVAQEVKTLATQTAKATQDITGQIAEMQEATEVSVLAIDKIQKKISEVEHISTIIAAAVHEQGAATQEIARNVRSAAAGTATMSGHVENIVRSVDETSTNAMAVSALAREFDEIASTMSSMVSRVDVFAQAVLAFG